MIIPWADQTVDLSSSPSRYSDHLPHHLPKRFSALTPISTHMLIDDVAKALSNKLSLDIVEVISVGKYVMFKARHGNRVCTVKIAKSCIEGEGYECKKLSTLIVREYENAQRISSPYVVKVLNIAVLDDTTVLFREYVEDTLSSILTKMKKLDIKQAVELSRKIAYALIDIHRADFVYTDLKPENIGIDSNVNVRLLDLDSLTKPFTRPSLISYDYAPPEYLSNGIVVKESDVYQLGLVMYRMITGKHTNPALGGEIMLEDIPSPLRSLVQDMLSPIPFARPSLITVINTLNSISRFSM